MAPMIRNPAPRVETCASLLRIQIRSRSPIADFGCNMELNQVSSGRWLQSCAPKFSLATDFTESVKWNILFFLREQAGCCVNACKRHVGITFFRGTELSDLRRLSARDLFAYD